MTAAVGGRLYVERLHLLIAVVVLHVGLAWAYNTEILRVFGYMGITHQERSYAVLATALLCACLPAVWLPYRIRRPSDIAYWVMYVFVTAPSCVVMVRLRTDLTDVQACGAVGLLCLASAVTRAGVVVPGVNTKPFPLPPRVFWWGVAATAAVCLAVLTAVYGIPTRFISFQDVYKMRSELSAGSGGGGMETLAQMLMQLMGKGINALLLVYGASRRKWWLVVLALGSALWLYCQTSHKVLLLLPPAILLLAWQRRLLEWPVAWGVLGLAALVILGAATRSLVVNALVTHRGIVVPGQLTTWYFDFFSTHPYARFGDTFYLRWLGYYPYSHPISALVGSVYRGNSDLVANANAWATAFANWGPIGVVVESWIMGRIWRWFDGLAGEEYFVLATGLIFSYAAGYWSNGALHQGLIGGGFLAVAVLVWVAPRTRMRAAGGPPGAEGTAPSRPLPRRLTSPPRRPRL